MLRLSLGRRCRMGSYTASPMTSAQSHREDIQVVERIHPSMAVRPLLEQVEDPVLVGSVASVIELVDEALHAIDELHLDPIETNPELESGRPLWFTLKPHLTEVLATARNASGEILRFFPLNGPTTEDLGDLELALAIDDLEGGMPSPIRDSYEIRLDALLAKVYPGVLHSIAGPLSETASILDRIVLEHAGRFESRQLRRDGLALLADTHELRTRTEQTLETTVAIILRGLSTAPIEEAYPPHCSGGHRAARIRGWAVDFLRALSTLPSHPVNPTAALAKANTVVNRSAIALEFGWLRAADRAVVQGFRRWLRSSESHDLADIKDRFESLTTWARQMGRINRRQLLIRHDLETIAHIRSMLRYSPSGPMLLAALKNLYGRDPRIDLLVQEGRDGRMPPLEGLSPLLEGIELALKPQTKL